MTIRDRKWDESESLPARLKKLNEGWRELRSFLGTLLPFSLRDVEFVGPAASLSFAVPGLSRPRGVVLVSLYREDTAATTPISFSWSYADARVTTTSFSALAAARWRATFLVIGGE
jgi:hypothetical protein